MYDVGERNTSVCTYIYTDARSRATGATDAARHPGLVKLNQFFSAITAELNSRFSDNR